MVLNFNPVLDRILSSATRIDRDAKCVIQFAALGSRCQITCSTKLASPSFQNDLLHWIAGFEAKYSRFLPQSVISRINESAGLGQWVEIDAETENLFKLCDEAHFLTHGTFDPTALPLIQLWNWKSPPKELPSESSKRQVMSKVGWRRVQRKPGKVLLPESGMCMDLGGIGKEYAVDQATQLASRYGIENILVDFGQDLFAAGGPGDGRPHWHIGLQDPKAPERCWTSLAIKDRAVATSGDYLRNFEIQGKRYGHILDIRSGSPVDNGCLSVSVISPRCTVAGLLATAAFVLGHKDGLRLLESIPETAACILTQHQTLQTRNFQNYVCT